MKYVVTLNGKKYDVEVNESEAVITSVSNAAPAAAPVAPVAAAPAPAASTAPSAPAAVVGTAVSGTQITSPMPGTILKLNVAEGQAVKAGDVVLILEAMKMENEIVAPCDGTIKQLLVSKGSTVDTDQILAVL
ncbi:MAG: biotin/lipoyl-containing protein [Oscillospiraceae bacterium]|jgi:biotin carboxyl carrier protein|nr:biotin/lipoyl-containing protein [Oscillospiraceae bacterium]CDA19610.1 glutaconyl-CoA decarboxylase subunit gamma [Ruminococcus sp. CAG:488]HBL99663.1 acetyl-CoA carboxylase biotin carboxyl carrier protein subunit [Oscillospiraceae bacterium]